MVNTLHNVVYVRSLLSSLKLSHKYRKTLDGYLCVSDTTTRLIKEAEADIHRVIKESVKIFVVRPYKELLKKFLRLSLRAPVGGEAI